MAHMFNILAEFVGHTMDDADLSQKGRTNTPVQEKTASAVDSNVNYEDLMTRIRHIVLTNRLRVCAIFSLTNLYDSLGKFSRWQIH